MALTHEERYERAWVKTIGRRHLSAFERALLDPDLVSLRQELALLDTRVSDLHRRFKAGESHERWLRAEHLLRELTAELAGEELNRARVAQLRVSLAELTHAARDEHAVWAATFELIELRRKLADTERKYEEQKHLLIPVTELLLLFDNLHHAIEVPDI